VSEPPPDDPASLLPLEAAHEHLLHWWREPVAGALSLAIGCFDTWKFGRDGGLTGSLDEALIIGGVILIAGTQRFIGRPLNGKPQ
jgi:hypothetical protein